MRQTRFTFIPFFLFCLCSSVSFGQLGITLDIEKPKPYEDRVLRSEKSDQKKFNIPRRFFQNTVTHYNYFFNANNKLNEVIELAKAVHQDDFSKLLPFYNYSLEATSANSIQLDSIILKSQSGIVLHDLRNDWIDNMYLLWGAAYYLRQDFDSANLTFQFINYAFADKEKDGYYRYIGSRMDGNEATQISTEEDRNLKDRLLSRPPSRNDAFIWQIRTHIAMGEFTPATSLIEALKLDPGFPERLEKDLQEVQALWFYKQGIWDSAAHYLSITLDNARNKQEKARWEFLTAQLYELSGDLSEAENYYEKAISRTTNPVLEIYARLNVIRTNRDSSVNNIDKNISELSRMVKRDKYQDYRDIIYFMAAQMEMERNDPDAAYALLLMGTRYNNGNDGLQNKAYLQLAQMAFDKRLYRQAYNFYDSLKLNDPALTDLEKINDRKFILGQLAGHIEVIERQDSLQLITNLPVTEREEHIKKLVKQIRKEQGLKDNIDFPSTGSVTVNSSPDIFEQVKGDWYFYNNTLRTRGAVDFKNRWGNRPNADNWRRSSAVGTTSNIANNQVPGNSPVTAASTAPSAEVTYESLLNNLPLTEETLKLSNDSIQNAMFATGSIYLNSFEDCNSMTNIYQTLQQRFPGFTKMDEVLFNLYFCYQKNGNTTEAAQVKQQLTAKYPKSKLTSIAITGQDPTSKSNNPDATVAYEKIYDQFIEGRFSEALASKKIADSMYGEGFWSPQQMYIESVYYIREREDSTAVTILNKINSRYPGTDLAQKAKTMVDVLSRRSQIEEELRNLQIERPAEDTFTVTEVFRVTRPEDQDSVITKPIDKPKEVAPQITATRMDSVITKPVITTTTAGYSFNAQQPHMAMIILNKVDPVFVNEARTAMFRYNREKYYNQTYDLTIIPLNSEVQVLVIGPFTNAKAALDYVELARPVTSTQIMSWLKADKYKYYLISQQNLEFLKTDLDINKYTQFLDQHLPGIF
jgi:tetratricopeptide (TPR) repeat protein